MFEHVAIINYTKVSTEISEIISRRGIEGIRKTSIQSLPIEIKNAKIVDYFFKTNRQQKYESRVLIRIPLEINAPIKPQDPTYGFAPVWRSSLVPGWGQFYKGENKKGFRLLLSDMALVSTYFIASYLSRDYNRRAFDVRDASRREFYNDWSNRSFTISSISGIMAGVIYIYNILDAISADGVKRYAYSSVLYVEVQDTQHSLCLSINF